MSETTETKISKSDKIAARVAKLKQKSAEWQKLIDEFKSFTPQRANKRSSVADEKREWHVKYYTRMIEENDLEIEALLCDDKEKAAELTLTRVMAKNVRLEMRSEYKEWSIQKSEELKAAALAEKEEKERARAEKKAQRAEKKVTATDSSDSVDESVEEKE